MLELKFAGYVDNFDRPIYKDKNGNKYADIFLGDSAILGIHTTTDYGEPNDPVEDFKIVKEFSDE